MAPTVAWRTAGLCVLCRQWCFGGGVTEGNSWSQGIKYSRLKRLVNASSCYYRVLVDKWPSSLQPHSRPSMLWLPRTERVILQWTSVNYFLDLLLWERIRSEQLGCLACQPRGCSPVFVWPGFAWHGFLCEIDGLAQQIYSLLSNPWLLFSL